MMATSPAAWVDGGEAGMAIVEEWLQLRCFDAVRPSLYKYVCEDGLSDPILDEGSPLELGRTELSQWLEACGDGDTFDYGVYGSSLALLAVMGLAKANHLSSHTAVFQAGVARHGLSELVAMTQDARLGNEGVGAIALTETDAGSDLGAQQTCLDSRGDSVLIEGTKRYVTLGLSAQWFLVSGFRVEEKISASPEQVAALVPRSAGVVSTPESSSSSAIASVGLAHLGMDGCKIPRCGILGDGRGAIGSVLAHDRFSVLFMALGLAMAATSKIIFFADQRKQFGSRLMDHQGYALAVSSMAEGLITMDSVCRVAVGEMQSGELSRQRLAAMKSAVVGAGIDVCGTAVRLGGARSFTSELGLSRIYEEATMLEPGGGTTNMQRTIVSGALSRLTGGQQTEAKQRA